MQVQHSWTKPSNQPLVSIDKSNRLLVASTAAISDLSQQANTLNTLSDMPSASLTALQSSPWQQAAA